MDTKFRLFSFLAVALFVVCSHATLVLEELKPWDIGPSVPHKRDSTIYDLVSSETWLWGPGGGSNEVLGNLTVLKPAEHENLLSLERFSSTLKSIKCEPTTLTFTFKDEQTFQYAKAAWGWVNGAPNRTFLAIPSKGDCDRNEFRVPYNVTSLHSNDPARIVTLDATLETWQEMAHSYELRVGSVNDLDSPSKAATRRDLSKSASISIDADYTFSTSVGPVSLGCSPCSSAGSLDFVFTLRQNWLGIPDGADFSVRPQGIELKAGFSLGLSEGPSKGTNTSDETLPLIDIPLPGGLSILGDVFSVGPQLIGELGWSLSAKDSLSASITATATVSDSSILQADLGDFSNNHFSGWEPHVEWGPLQIQAKEAVKFQIYVGITAQLEATVLGKGVEVGVLLKAPYFQIEGDLLVAITDGACKPGDGKNAAVKVIPSYGVEVDLNAGFVGGDTKAKFTIASANFPMATVCEAFDLPGTGGGSGPASSTLPGPTPPPGSPSTPNTCTVNGVAGTCIDMNTCEGGGKVATPGSCPNDPNNVECCTPKSSSNPSQPNTCTINGMAGTCIDVSTCKGSGKVATPGYCPNDPNNVECCTPKSTSTNPNTCTVKGTPGTCIDVSACESSGKVATPSYCPNDPNNVECCTPKSATTTTSKPQPKPTSSSHPATPQPNKCTVQGKSGICVDVTDCKNNGDTATPGFCPKDPENVQCCTGSTKLAPIIYKIGGYENTCSVNGQAGTCLDKSACASAGKVATPGYCPNDPENVQCCTAHATTCGPPQCNQATVNLISGFESFRANVYTDATGNSEIGYGHLCQNAKCPGLGYSIPLSEPDGKKLLASDMAVAAKCITRMMNDKVTLNINEYGALVSWAFNVGCGGAQSSTLVKRLNNGEKSTVVLPAELVKWVDGNNGQVIPGLVKRRDAEIALSKTASSDPGLPPKC